MPLAFCHAAQHLTQTKPKSTPLINPGTLTIRHEHREESLETIFIQELERDNQYLSPFVMQSAAQHLT